MRATRLSILALLAPSLLACASATRPGTAPDAAVTPPDAAGVASGLRLAAPLSTALATSRRPTLHWVPGPGDDGARVQLCADRACTRVLATLDATGSSIAPAAELPAGVVFWRAYGRHGATVAAVPSATWQFTVGARTATGPDTSWGSTLDVNGDGYADLAVGAPYAGNVGAVLVYFGSAAGLHATPDQTLMGPSYNSQFASTVVSAGDVNGDGFADLAVGAYGTGEDTGAVYVYLGSAAGLGETPSDSLMGHDLRGNFGAAVSGAGDVNGDGYADLAVGANMAATGAGAAYVYFGGAGGLGATADLTLPAPEGSAERYGTSVSAGDVNGDGYGDLAVGTAGEPHYAYVYLGSATGPRLRPSRQLGRMGVGSGARPVVAGDLDGDGYADLALGVQGAATGARQVLVFRGDDTGPGAVPGVTLTLPGTNDDFVTSLAGAGDLDGDGFAELAVGTYSSHDNMARTFVFSGSSAGLRTTPSFTFAGPGAGEVSAAGVGDVNLDGRADLARGEPMGLRLQLFLGAAAGLGTTPSQTLAMPAGLTGPFGESFAWRTGTRALLLARR